MSYLLIHVIRLRVVLTLYAQTAYARVCPNIGAIHM